ncbi:hypothetical protein N7516_009609 [Penicillium verrucosum]|uniref:uncharacterized protein n=1 Tax=Penicillium verrucosum TaxID=60171 RepID=UPI002544DDBF|nr:uncharacterized protein N7516_009609 [Penicillium verrucosum]KAJ5921906.1 hypothetical protein N7516_009609 [Penicillium verrucosum]
MTAEEDPTQHLHREIFNTLHQYAFLCAVAGNHSALVPLGSIKDDITTLLGNYSLSQIQVEVINGDHFYVPTLFPIRSTTELAIAFHHLKDEIGFSTRLLEQNGNGFDPVD